jgi:hypothetical protein
MVQVGLPRWLVFVVAMGWGIVALERITGQLLPLCGRLLLAGSLTLLPLATSLVMPESVPVAVLALGQCVALLIIGLCLKVRPYLWTAVGVAAVGPIAYALAWEQRMTRDPARLFIELAFLFLLVGFINSLYGERLWLWLKRLRRV